MASVYKVNATGAAAIAASMTVPASSTYQLVSVTVALDGDPTTSELFSVTLNAQRWARLNDVLVYSLDLSAATTTNLVWFPDEPFLLEAGDAIDVAFPNHRDKYLRIANHGAGGVMAYTTALALRVYKDISSSADDALLTDLIAAAQRKIDMHCKRTFEASADTTRHFDFSTEYIEWLTLNLDKDLCSITTITNGDGVVVASDEYHHGTTQQYAVLCYSSIVQQGYSLDI